MAAGKKRTRIAGRRQPSAVEPVEASRAEGDPAREHEADTPEAGAPRGGQPVESAEQEHRFLVVGIGASAGGLEALAELTANVPIDSMAFIVVQHLAPKHESALAQLLARSSRVKVETAADGAVLEPNHVYVIPPNADLAVMHGVIHLIAPSSPSGPRLPIDFMFRSLAEDQGPAAIGIVLSGTGSDGTFGLKAIKAAGGVTFAQKPSSAKYDGMPRSALASGAADFCLTPAEIGDELSRIALVPRSRSPKRESVVPPQVQEQLGKLFIFIRTEFGNDLSHYKSATVDRRIERRMTLHKIARLDEYVRYVQSSRDELRALYDDMLITVTSFFRDAEVFEALKTQILPRLLENKESSESLRAWVPACATGEEAYSIAMCLLEFCEEKVRDARIQVFGTDIDEDSVAHARRGVYPANIALDVSAERLNRFFVKKDGQYQISRRIRDMVVFSKQNVLKDAPFSHIDLVSCRNLLIYLQPSSQKRVLRTLHYALNPASYLLLGTSETVGDAPDLFSLVDRKNKIYCKKHVTSQAALDVGFGAPTATNQASQPRLAPARPTLNLQGLVDRKVLELYGPPGVVVSEDNEILQFRGHTGPYLDPAPGTASLNILKIARFELHIELKRAIERAVSQRVRVTSEVTYNDGDSPSGVRLDVVPLQDPETGSRCLAVLFHRLALPPDAPTLPTEERGEGGDQVRSLSRRVVELERELAVTKEFLQTMIEERESTTEELKSANEELQSSNEELQSTNEELETSKEEMQSTNEELTTVNDELQNRMAELSQTNDDLHNVLAGVDNAVIIVGMDLRIRRFTGAAEKLFNLVPGDIGRPIDFLDPFFQAAALGGKVSSVVDSLSTIEEEFFAQNQQWYLLKISPYKTLDHNIRGALICVTDIDVRKRATDVSRDAGAYAARFLGPLRQPLLIIDTRFRIVWTNELFLSTFQLSAEEAVGSLLPDLGTRQWMDPGLRQRLEEAFSGGKLFRDYQARIVLQEKGERLVTVGGSQVPVSAKSPLVLVSFDLANRPPQSGGEP